MKIFSIITFMASLSLLMTASTVNADGSGVISTVVDAVKSIPTALDFNDKKKTNELLDQVASQSQTVKNNINYSLDLTKCTHKSPADIAKIENAKKLEEASDTLRLQMAEYLEKNSKALAEEAQKMENSNASDASQLGVTSNLKDIYVRSVQMYDKLVQGFKLAEKYNDTALNQYKDALSSAEKNQKHDKELFSECGTSLVVDYLNAMEHVRYFYPRQASDGSYKTFKDESKFSSAEENLQKLIDAKTIDEADSAFNSGASSIGSMGTIQTLTGQMAPDKIGYMIDARLRSYWACGMGSAFTYHYLAWARKSQMIGEKSSSQYKNKEQIIKKAMELRTKACEAWEGKMFHPSLIATKVCKAWAEDTMYFSQSCEAVSSVDSQGTKYLSSVSLKADEAKRKINQQVELTPFGRTFVIDAGIKSSEKRAEDIKNALTNFEKQKKTFQDYLDIYTKGKSTTSFILKELNRSLLAAAKGVYSLTSWMFSSAYAKAEQLFFTSMIYPDGRRNVCHYPAPSGQCYSLVSQIDSWIFPSSATSQTVYLDRLAAELADSLQGQRIVTKRAHQIMDQINASEKMINQRYEQARRELAKGLPGGLAEYESLHQGFYQSYEKVAMALAQTSGGVKSQNQRRSPSAYQISSISSSIYENETRQEYTEADETSNTPDAVNGRAPAEFSGTISSEDIEEMNNPTYKLKELTIHSDKDSSLFDIISSRYLKKYSDF